MNLPNALSAGRIAITPLIAVLPFAPSSTLRLVAFVLFVVAGISDYYDGMLARTRKQETNLGKMLDPLADKLLLVGTFVPMFILAHSGTSLGLTPPYQERLAGVVPSAITLARRGDYLIQAFPFFTPLGTVGLPWWILAVVVGREAFMTIFRQAAARRGVVIGAIGPAKWKTGFQLVWQGSAYFWFFAATLASERAWTGAAWRGFAYFNGTVGTATMLIAVVLTLYSLWLYLARYGWIFVGGRHPADANVGRHQP